jgi:outer membrane protein TolC
LLATCILATTLSVGILACPIADGPTGTDEPPSSKPSDSGTQDPAQRRTSGSRVLGRDEAVGLALGQASNFQQAQLVESIAEEDVKQARAAFLPRITIPASAIYNSPSVGSSSPTPRADRFSFINANAVTEYEALAGVSGDLDVTGRLRAALRRQIALLEAAHAGTEIARRALIQAVDEAYYGLGLAAARRESAELSFKASEEFEHITSLLLSGGEVAQVDLVRARLQTASRRDDLEQARANESAAADTLRVLIGYDFSRAIEVADLSSVSPDSNEIVQFAEDALSRRPELAQLDAERRAAEQDAKAARAERLPQVSYSLNGGFDSESLGGSALHDHSGVLATFSVTIPIFDWGASKSRERQAKLRTRSVDSQRILTQRTLNQQFYTARALALSAAARASFLRGGLADAAHNVDAAIARYRAGETQIIEVLDSQNTLAAQRAALNQAIFDFEVARARLIQLAGR